MRRYAKISLWTLFAICGPLLAPVVLAQAATNFAWDRNVEPDILQYNVWICTTGPACFPDTKIGSVPQTAVGLVPKFPIPANQTGNANITAVNTSGNESAGSNVVPFNRLAPSAPAHAR